MGALGSGTPWLWEKVGRGQPAGRTGRRELCRTSIRSILISISAELHSEIRKLRIPTASPAASFDVEMELMRNSNQFVSASQHSTLIRALLRSLPRVERSSADSAVCCLVLGIASSQIR